MVPPRQNFLFSFNIQHITFYSVLSLNSALEPRENTSTHVISMLFHTPQSERAGGAWYKIGNQEVISIFLSLCVQDGFPRH